MGPFSVSAFRTSVTKNKAELLNNRNTYHHIICICEIRNKGKRIFYYQFLIQSDSTKGRKQFLARGAETPKTGPGHFINRHCSSVFSRCVYFDVPVWKVELLNDIKVRFGLCIVICYSMVSMYANQFVPTYVSSMLTS